VDTAILNKYSIHACTACPVAYNMSKKKALQPPPQRQAQGAHEEALRLELNVIEEIFRLHTATHTYIKEQLEKFEALYEDHKDTFSRFDDISGVDYQCALIVDNLNEIFEHVDKCSKEIYRMRKSCHYWYRDASADE